MRPEEQHTDNLDFDIDLDELLGERVNLDETRIDSTVESAKLCDQADVALADGAVRIGAADAAGNGTEASDDRTQCVDCAVH